MNDTIQAERADDLDRAPFAEFAELGSATVYEAAGRHGLIDVALEQLIPGTSVAGPARIAACAQDDNWAVHALMPTIRPGDILVLTMPEARPVALVGELLLTQAKVHGAVGVLVDASVRDVTELEELGLPVWTRWRRVSGAVKNEPGNVDIPVTIGGARIEPGDIVILDADGAVVVPRQQAEATLSASRTRRDKEAAMRERLYAGEFSYDIHGLREKAARQGGAR